MLNNIYDCTILELPKVYYRAGNLTAIESERHLPFKIQRVFYLYDVPGGVSRGGHAHKKLHQFIVAMSGSFDIKIDDGSNRRTYSLNRPYYGLYVVPGVWTELDNFSSGAICTVIASHAYDEEDYLREYEEFLKHRKHHDTSIS